MAVRRARHAVAAGLFADFVGVSLDQLWNQMAKFRYMFGGKSKCPLVIRFTTGGGFSAAAQHLHIDRNRPQRAQGPRAQTGGRGHAGDRLQLLDQRAVEGAAAGIGLAIGIVLALLTLAAPAAATLAVVLTIPVMIYLFIKFALTAPVIAIEGERNPIKALARSWKLTKGNSFRIVLFLFLGAVFVVNGTLFLLAVVALAERLRRLPLDGVPAGWLARGLHAGGAALFAGLAVRLALADHS